MSEPKKVNVDLEQATRLLHPRHTVLVTCTDKSGKPNIITLAWSTPTSSDPPMIAISIAPRRTSHRMIEETGEFVVNVPTMDIVKQTLVCGRTSGKEVDKFKKARLTAMPAKKVRPPLIKECIASLECRVVNQVTTGNHTLFVGRVEAAHVSAGVFARTIDVKRVKPVFHMGGDDFVTISPRIVSPPRPKKTHRA